jgi:hypothetical protein
VVLWWGITRYLSEGMDELEFVEAGQCLDDVIKAYRAHES